MYQLNIVDCMLLWMDLLSFLERVEASNSHDNVLAAHNCLPDDVVVYDVFVAGNSMAGMHIRRMHLRT